jgi:predicted nucleotidyltransferase
LFAKGAIRILSQIPQITHLCFGAENANADAFYQAAKLCNEEPKEVAETIKLLMKDGASYAKARAQAWEGKIPNEILTSPNNILGLEYTKALLAENSNISILPITRIGGGYTDKSLNENFSSASAIRAALTRGDDVHTQLPDYVLKDSAAIDQAALERIEKYALLSQDESETREVCDCTEGLENALKKAAQQPQPLTETLTCARYTSSRIRRIALQNALHIQESVIRLALQSTLYLRVLAIRSRKKELLSALGESNSPVIIRAHDEKALQGIAKVCFEKDEFADKIYRLINAKANFEKNIFDIISDITLLHQRTKYQ